MELLIFFWLLFAVVVAVAANGRGRSPIGWLLLACVISPLLAVILLVILPKADQEIANAGTGKVKVPAAKACPFCAEVIKPQAIVCKHCGRDLPKNERPT